MVSDALTIGPDPGELQIHLMRVGERNPAAEQRGL